MPPWPNGATISYGPTRAPLTKATARSSSLSSLLAGRPHSGSPTRHPRRGLASARATSRVCARRQPRYPCPRTDEREDFVRAGPIAGGENPSCVRRARARAPARCLTMPQCGHKILVMTRQPTWGRHKGPSRPEYTGECLAAATFKARCLELMDRVRETGTEYVITKHGQPVAKLVPYRATRKTSFFGSMKRR